MLLTTLIAEMLIIDSSPLPEQGNSCKRPGGALRILEGTLRDGDDEFGIRHPCDGIAHVRALAFVSLGPLLFQHDRRAVRFSRGRLARPEDNPATTSVRECKLALAGKKRLEGRSVEELFESLGQRCICHGTRSSRVINV